MSSMCTLAARAGLCVLVSLLQSAVGFRVLQALCELLQSVGGRRVLVSSM